MSIILKDKCYGLIIGCALGDCMGSIADFKHQESSQDKVVSPEESEGYWNEATTLLLCQCEALKTGESVLKYIFESIANGWGTSNGEITNLSKSTIVRARTFGTSRTIQKPCTHNTDCLLLIGALAMHYYRSYEVGHVEAFMNPLASGCRLCMDACKFYYALLDLTLHGGTKKQILNPASYGNLILSPQVLSVLDTNEQDPVPHTSWASQASSDHVINALKMVIQVFSTTWNYEEGVVAIINRSEAPVRTGAILGQLCGAYYGLTDIKEDWIGLLQRKDLLRAVNLPK